MPRSCSYEPWPGVSWFRGHRAETFWRPMRLKKRETRFMEDSDDGQDMDKDTP